jgi:hypothetical protein
MASVFSSSLALGGSGAGMSLVMTMFSRRRQNSTYMHTHTKAKKKLETKQRKPEIFVRGVCGTKRESFHVRFDYATGCHTVFTEAC